MSVLATTALPRAPNHPFAAVGAGLALLAYFAVAACRGGEPSVDSTGVPAERAAAEDRRRGLWVLCEGSQRVLEHPERIVQLVADAQSLGATDLFVQVYRGGRAWFESTRADAGPYREIVEAHGFDTLKDLLARAHAAGLRVHAWVNVLSLSSNRDAPLVRDLGRDAVVADQSGRSILEYPDLEVPQPDRRYYRMGTRAVWLDPAAPGVAKRLAATFAELAANYPELDGLHLDYIRYPDVLPFSPGSRFGVGLDFGYGAPTRARFEAETGHSAPFRGSLANANRWDEWRREQLTELVRRVRSAAQAARPGLALSAAVWSYADRAYLTAGQDWRGWLEEGLLEFAVPMAYTLDDRLLRYQAQSFAGSPERERVWIGLGTWLFASRPERALEQIAIAREAGTAAESLFSYDSIVATPELRRTLIAGLSGAR